MGRTLEFNIIRSGTHIGVIHVFNAGGVDACLIDFSNKGKCHMGVFKHSQHIKAIGRHGLQLQGNLRDDAQGTLAAHHELLHAVASGAFFQASAHFHDFALRSNHFQSINLITGYAIAHCLVATSISCQISTNHAGLSAAGIARIEDAGVIGHFLDIHSAHTCFGNQIQAFGIHFDDFVQALHQQDDATAHGDSAIGKASATATHGDGHHVLVAQLHDGSNLLGIAGTHHSLGHAEATRVIFLVSFVHIQLVGIGKNIFFADDSLYFSQKFWTDRIISSHYFPS